MVMSGGTIGELQGLLVRAAEAAIEKRSEHINRTLLLELTWLPPDLRDAHASASEHGQPQQVSYRERLSALGHTDLTDDSAAAAQPIDPADDRADPA